MRPPTTTTAGRPTGRDLTKLRPCPPNSEKRPGTRPRRSPKSPSNTPSGRSSSFPPGPPRPAPRAPGPVRFSRDGMLQLDDGSFRRGPLERKEEVVLVAEKAVPMWSIEATHLDAPQFIRGETRRLDDLGNRIQGAPGAKREALVGLFLEVQRQRDRWKTLEPLCTASELPAPAPQKRLDSFQSSI